MASLGNWNDAGSVIMLVGFVVTFYAVAAYILGLRQQNPKLLHSGKGAVLTLAIITTLAITVLFAQFATSDFSNKYVAEHSSSDLAMIYKISALWAGNEGSLLLWAWVLTVYAAIVAYGKHREGEDMVPYVTAILMAIALFFMFVLNFVTKPFAQLFPVPKEGMGLNPLLQDPGMVIHPPTQYLGYVGFSVPFAYAMTALLLRKAGDAWIKVTRRWTLITWLFLSIGIIFGGQWAYVVLGWGGYWAWDPVENASLLPWLTGTAFLHSVMIQERKGMLKVWNIMLIIVTFLLTILGTFLSRSGVLASVHAFSDTTLGAWFLVFMGTSLAASLYLAFDRMPLLREENQFESILSKESSFLLNNVLFVGSAFAVFWGTIFPLISEAVRGVKVTVGPPFYNQVNVPIGIVLILLVGICPLIPWRKATVKNLVENFLYPFLSAISFIVIAVALGIRKPIAIIAFATCVFVLATIVLEFYRGVVVRRRMTGEPLGTAFWRLTTRNRRRYGGYIIHLAIVVMIIGITGSSVYQQEKVYTVPKGQTMTIGDYQVTYPGLSGETRGRVEIVYSDLQVAENGVRLGTLRSQKEFHPNSEQGITRVGILGGYKEDLYVILNGWEQDETANFKLVINPLVAWVWIGWYLMAAGTIYAAWPDNGKLSTAVSA